MTRQEIEAVFARVLTWPKDRQEDAVQLLLAMERQDAEPYRLTPEQWAEVQIGLDEAERGEFATDEEMTALWKKCGL